MATNIGTVIIKLDKRDVKLIVKSIDAKYLQLLRDGVAFMTQDGDPMPKMRAWAKRVQKEIA